MAQPHVPLWMFRAVAPWPLGVAEGTRQLCETILLVSGWLVMLQLGAAMSWSWFGGLGPVVVWWLWQVFDPLGPRALTRPMACVWALCAVVGVWLVVHWGPEAWGWLGLSLATVAWAQVCRGFVPRSGGITGSGAHVWVQLLAWGFAAWCLADPLAWQTRWVWLVPVWLLWAVSVPTPAPVCHPASARPRAHTPLASDPVMAVMMASLLWMGQWCAAAGFGLVQALWAHGAAMVLAHSAALLAWQAVAPGHTRSVWAVGLLLTGLGAVTIGLTSDWLAMWCAMALLSAGSACRQGVLRPDHITRPLAVGTAAVLLAMGVAAPVHGPLAIAIGLTASAALVCAARASRRTQDHQ